MEHNETDDPTALGHGIAADFTAAVAELINTRVPPILAFIDSRGGAEGVTVVRQAMADYFRGVASEIDVP